MLDFVLVVDNSLLRFFAFQFSNQTMELVICTAPTEVISRVPDNMLIRFSSHFPYFLFSESCIIFFSAEEYMTFIINADFVSITVHTCRMH